MPYFAPTGIAELPQFQSLAPPPQRTNQSLPQGPYTKLPLSSLVLRPAPTRAPAVDLSDTTDSLSVATPVSRRSRPAGLDDDLMATTDSFAFPTPVR